MNFNVIVEDIYDTTSDPNVIGRTTCKRILQQENLAIDIHNESALKNMLIMDSTGENSILYVDNIQFIEMHASMMSFIGTINRWKKKTGLAVRIILTPCKDK